jgi:hypothetical protein
MVGRAPRCDVPPKKDSDLPPELAEFVRQQHEDAKFKARLWLILKRWVTVGFAILLGATSGLDAVTKLIAWIKQGGPNP